MMKPIKNIQEMISSIINNPELVHYSHIKTAYKNDDKKVVIILLNVFFETVNERALKTKPEEIKDEEATKGSVRNLLDRLSHDEKLRLRRILGTIDYEMYGIIDSIRKARNEFAHDLEKYSPKNA